MSNGALQPDGLEASLLWRYSVRKFDPSKRIDARTWAALERSLVLSASSYGLQPWTFVVVEDPAVRRRLRAASWGQPQVTDASHLVVLASRVRVTEADVDRHLSRVMEVQRATAEELAPLRRGILRTLADPASLPGGSEAAWARSQVYVALGQFLASAAVMRVDACAMEGFEPAAYDEILGLTAAGYTAAAAAAAGYRAADDPFAGLPKVRFPGDQVVRRV